MLGVNWSRKSDSLVTRVVPVAKAEDGSDLYLDGTEWVDSPLINNYPKVRMDWLRVNGQVGKDDGSGTETNWTEESLLAEMRRQASEVFSIEHADEEAVELTVDFTLLGDTEEYRQYRGLEKVYLYDRITVTNVRVGLSLSLQVTETEWDAIHGRYQGVRVANAIRYSTVTVPGYSIPNGAITGRTIQAGPPPGGAI